MKPKTCCFTGHRDLTEEQEIKIAQDLAWQVDELINRGYTHFISGMEDGSDIIAAQIVGYFRRINKDLILEAAISDESRFHSKNEAFRYAMILCNKITVIQKQYDPGCFQKRNKYMVDKSDVVIAIWNGRTSGGTYNTIKYAQSLGKEIIQINPLTGND